MTGSIARVAVLAWLGTLLVGCGRDKEIAEKDVKAAEQAVAAVQEDGSKLIPDRMKAVNAVIEKAKDQLISGDYRGAMKAAEESMVEAQRLPAAIATKKAELTTAFNVIADSVPAMFAAVKARLDSILTSKHLPAGVDPGKVAVLKDELPGWQDEWHAATASFQSGNLAAAVRQATAVKARAEDARVILGLHH
jgi:shikimate kinase